MNTNDALQTKSHDELLKIVSSLQEDIAKNKVEIDTKNNEIQTMNSEIEALKEKLRLALLARFGKKSEKTPNDAQYDLFDEAQVPENVDEVEQTDAEITVPGYKRKKKGRKLLPDYLPRVKRYYDLADAWSCPYKTGPSSYQRH